MQILTLPNSSPDQIAAVYSRTENRETFYQTQSSITVEISDPGDTVMLSQTNTSVYMDSIYTSEGLYLEGPLQIPEGDGSTETLSGQEAQEAGMVSEEGRRVEAIATPKSDPP